MVPLHILAGLLALAAGTLAFATYKGGRLHSKGGLVFVGAMLVMTATGAVTAVVRENSFSKLNKVAAALTAYLVITGFLAVQRRMPMGRSVDAATALLALLLAGVSCSLGMQAVGQRGAPAPAYFVFGTLALLGAAGDAREYHRAISGSRRVARHLWRLGTALLIATASFFLGQATVFPAAVRKPALLAIPVLLVLGALLYWLVRVRFTPMHPRVRRFARQARDP